MNFTRRSYNREALDNLSLSGQTLKDTLSSLQFINSLFGNHRQMAKAVLDYCNQFPDKKIISIVDLGCGGGDLIHHISRKLKKRGIKARFLGIDGNPDTIMLAKSKNPLANNMDFRVADILDSDFSIPDCEILISSHFIYHFEDKNLVRFLNKIKEQGISYTIFSELFRSKLAYWLFRITKEILPISKMAKKDGLLAIQRAYTLSELDKILQKSQLNQYTIEKKLWFRSLTKISNP